jgi:hypothetical protein
MKEPAKKEPGKSGKKPLSVCVANEVEGKTYWTKVGVAFPHNEGKGFNVIIAPNISVSGKLVVMEDKEERQE